MKFKNRNLKVKVSKNNLIYLFVFAFVGLGALQIPVNQLAGSRVSFTLVELFAPISGAFLGSPLGVAAVFLMGALNIVLHGVSSIDKGSIVRLFPILFGVWAFSKKDKLSIFVCLAAIISFNLNPVGRSVWYYSLFWMIPIVLWPLREKFLIARSLASTFTAHAAGGAIWIWAFSLPAGVWTGLIPVVIAERLLFAFGMSASFVLMNNAVAILSSKKLIPSGLSFESKYIFKSSK